MKLAVFGVISMCLVAACFADAGLSGNWVGEIEISQKQMPLRMHFEGKDQAPAGTITLPTERIFEQPLSSITYEANSVQLELKVTDHTWTFQGKLNGQLIQGDFALDDTKGTFELIRLAPVTTQTYKKYYGIYEVDPNLFLYVRTWDELGENTLTYFDSSGRIAALLPTSDTDYFSGPSLMIPSPVSEEVRFGKKDGIAGLWLKESGKESRFARRIEPYSEEEVAVQNGPVTLSGTLLIPSTGAPHPAVVLVHGSSTVTRDFFGPISYDFVRKGIAVLSYDKRGVGNSTGHWMDGDFQDLAGDALAAVQFLKNRKEIDPLQIGLLGISQGGWIAPLAASRSGDIGFLVLVSAPIVKPFQQIEMSQEAELRVMMVPEEEITESSRKLREQLDWLRSEETLRELEADLKKLQEQNDAKRLSEQGLENPRYLLWLRRVLDYDPLPALQKTTCPVLLVYGEMDRTVPFQENKEGLEQTLKNAGNQQPGLPQCKSCSDQMQHGQQCRIPLPERVRSRIF